MTFGDQPTAYYAPPAYDLNEIAKRDALIASQAARIRELEEGLEPFAKAFDRQEDYETLPDGSPVMIENSDNHALYEMLDGEEGPQITYGHFRRARSLLSRKGGE